MQLFMLQVNPDRNMLKLLKLYSVGINWVIFQVRNVFRIVRFLMELESWYAFREILVLIDHALLTSLSFLFWWFLHLLVARPFNPICSRLNMDTFNLKMNCIITLLTYLLYVYRMGKLINCRNLKLQKV